MKKKEFCATNGYVKYAGIHLIVDLWHAKNLNSPAKIKKILTESVKACDATLLSIDVHKFSPNGGVSGVAVLKESHISIHSWPEFNYAALDIFVCGTVNPYKAVPILKKGFSPKNMQITELKRGTF